MLAFCQNIAVATWLKVKNHLILNGTNTCILPVVHSRFRASIEAVINDAECFINAAGLGIKSTDESSKNRKNINFSSQHLLNHFVI